MRKVELIKKVAEETGLSQKEARKVIDKTFELIKESIIKDKIFRVPNFGTFKLVKTKPRDGRNPKTGQKIRIPSKKRVKFKMSSKFFEI